MKSRTLVCNHTCYYKRRKWVVGERKEFEATEPDHKYFELKGTKKSDKLEVRAEPNTLSELQKEEARQALEGVGHGLQPDKSKDNNEVSKDGKDVNDIFG